MQWEPFGRHNAREGSRLAFGEYVDAQYAIEKADVILSLDADFLCAGTGGLKHARAFASRRRIEGDRAQLNRFYAVESTPTNTGTKADHRLPLRASEIEALRPRAWPRRSASRRADDGAVPEAAQALDGTARQGSAGGARPQSRDRRRRPAAGRPCARARDERGARQRRHHGRLHADRRSAPDQSARRRCRSWSAR